MSRRKSPEWRVCAIYDTETCNMGSGRDVVAWCVLYQINDLRNIDVREYRSPESDDIRLYRSEDEVLGYLRGLIEWGRVSHVVPVVCAYNLMFDLRSLMFDLRMRYEMGVNAQSSTSAYTLDLLDSKTGAVLLRFWDTFYLDMRGLSAMGQVAGLPKADGDWDYSLVRTPETALTDEETYYASRDVQVIPAYLRWLLEANPFLEPGMLGRNVLTKTSVVRQMARSQIAPVRVGSRTLGQRFVALCRRNLAPDFDRYALRKACFRGGLTFTSAYMASLVTHNVASLDVTSMHHTFMAAKVPVDFHVADPHTLERMAERVVATTREQVLRSYLRPFDFALHAKVRFRKLRLRRGSAFERWGIATLARGKVGTRVGSLSREFANDAARMQDESNRRAGWRDSVVGCEIAFGKVYAAEVADVFLSEVELWVCSRVYEWDSMEVLFGECSTRWMLPPAYVGLQSMMLFEMKSALKPVVAGYVEGAPYVGEVSPLVPDSIADGVRSGTLTHDFVDSYYTSTVKGMFNGIYGTQAQDLYKPGYMVEFDGEVVVDSDDVATADNYSDLTPKGPRVLYNYGMRIVGRSRMHLVLAIELLHEGLGARVDVCGGDTDSLKVRCDPSVTDDDLLDALLPLHDAADRLLSLGYHDLRTKFPELASDMADVGHFDVERCGRTTRYAYHIELWNKCRLSVDSDLHAHVTAAGLSRPHDAYNMVDWVEDAIADAICDGRSVDDVLADSLGYNVYVANDVSHALERSQPSTTRRVVLDVRDRWGDVRHVDLPAVCALYPVGRMFGDMLTATANENVSFLLRHYNRVVDTTYRVRGAHDHNE